MKRYNLGFKYFGFPEQCKTGKYITFEDHTNFMTSKFLYWKNVAESDLFYREQTLRIFYNIRLITLATVLVISLLANLNQYLGIL